MKVVRRPSLGVDRHTCHSTMQLFGISVAEDRPVKRMPRDHVVHTATANFQVGNFPVA